MQIRPVIGILGNLIIFLSLAMILPLLVSVYYREAAIGPLAVSILVTSLAGWGMRKVDETPENITQREGFAVVTFGWILASAFGALPFVLSGALPSFLDAFFETMSGFTTTGATVIADIENLPQGILLWRSQTQWLGGMGIIVLFVAVLPKLSGGIHLFRAEVPGPIAEKFHPKINDTAKALWRIYVGISLLEFILLILAGMTPLDALNHTFTTMATGGYSTRNASIAAFDSVYIESIIVFFMFVAGGNFALYYLITRGKVRSVIADGEFRFYVLVTGISTALVALNLFFASGLPLGQSIREGVFQVVSILTTTGYTTANYDAWPHFSRGLLLMLMFLGGSGGSTAGAIKQIRMLILIKYGYRELFRLAHPRAVIPIRVGRRTIPEPVVSSTVAFLFLYLSVAILSTFAMAATGLDLVSAFSSVAATLGNVGPALGVVGPVHNYADIHPAGKALLSLNMLMGRLEIYSVLVLLLPEILGRRNIAWKK